MSVGITPAYNDPAVLIYDSAHAGAWLRKGEVFSNPGFIDGIEFLNALETHLSDELAYILAFVLLASDHQHIPVRQSNSCEFRSIQTKTLQLRPVVLADAVFLIHRLRRPVPR